MIKFADMEANLISFMGTDAAVVNAARVSFAKEVQEFTDKDRGLLNYLAKHNHWSPFAHTSISVRCKVPIFLARQLVKHQVGGNWNEESRRYIDSEVEFYAPVLWHSKPDSVKQGAGDALSLGTQDNLDRLLTDNTEQAYTHYTTMLSEGVAPEEARMVLPLNSMTNFIWTGSVLFFHRVVSQRSDAHAQTAARDFAALLEKVVQPCYPNSWEALNAAR